MSGWADIGVIGLAVMGQNLILNMNDRGYTVVAYNRSVAKVDEFMAGPAKNSRVIAARSIEELVSSLTTPRKVMLMVKAGAAVDETIERLLPLLSPGDCIIDGGNSHFADTGRRVKALEAKGLHFIGTGISGGEEGARHGPSIMPGGSEKAWPLVKELFRAIAAKTPDGAPCCDWVGAGGAGHFVKMVHNAIEYGDMQIIAEAYHLMRDGLNLPAKQMCEVFAKWNAADLNSYLVEITRDILSVNDVDGAPLVDKILDAAGQKGTGKWFGISSFELAVPATLIAEAVFARSLSAKKEERVAASAQLSGPAGPFTGDKNAYVNDIGNALLASKIVSYAQGFMLLREAAREYSWNLDYGSIALLWRSGCIIRSVFLDKIKSAFDADKKLSNLLLDPYFSSSIDRCQSGWRNVVATGALNGIPLPAISSALAFYDGYRCARLPANLLQAQRDFFGAHQYERVDKPRGEFFHTDWTGRGGAAASSVYGG
jgi:6-phosphogluconate dehydrogenase